jgi:hypothetical protein
MTIEKAKEILAYNKLNLSIAGMELLPVKTVNINTFIIIDDGNYEEYNSAVLFGLLKEDRSPYVDFWCPSYFVNFKDIFYYREMYKDAIEVIEAIRTVNGYYK